MKGERTERVRGSRGPKEYESHAGISRVQEEVEENKEELSKMRDQVAVTVLACT